MAGEVVVGSYFVLNQVSVGDDVVFCAVQSTGLNCGVNVALSHCDTNAAHCVHHVNAGFGTHNADLHASQFSGSGNSVVTSVQVTSAQRVCAQNGEAVCLGGVVQGVQLAGFEYLLLVFDGVVYVGSAQNSEVGSVGFDNGVSYQRHVQNAHGYLFQSLSLVTQLCVGVDFQLVAAFGASFQLVGDPLQGLCFGVGDGLVESNLQNLGFNCAVIGASVGAAATCYEREAHDESQDHCENFLHFCSSWNILLFTLSG